MHYTFLYKHGAVGSRNGGHEELGWTQERRAWHEDQLLQWESAAD